MIRFSSQVRETKASMATSPGNLRPLPVLPDQRLISGAFRERKTKEQMVLNT